MPSDASLHNQPFVFDPGIDAARRRATVRLRSTGITATLVGWYPVASKAKVIYGGRRHVVSKADVDLNWGYPDEATDEPMCHRPLLCCCEQCGDPNWSERDDA